MKKAGGIKIGLAVLCWLVALPGMTQVKKMCITVDDLPAVTNGISGHAFKQAITDGIVAVFDEYNIPAIGYVNEGKLYRDGVLDTLQLRMLEQWLEHDLDLGNHTFSHLNYHKVSFDVYASNILEGEQLIKKLATQYGKEVRFFRHPYLRSGLRKSLADSLTHFLTRHGYTASPVTIDNDDYLFAYAYSKAYKKQDTLLMQRIGRDYIDYMEDKLLFYERQSKALFGRHIDQTLLLHANYLNAHYLKKLVEMYQEHGYTFVSQEEVLNDEAYRSEVTRFGNWGISWIDRWALSNGKKGDFFADDPQTPAYIRKLTQ